MEARIARLESDVAHIRTDVGDIKVDLRALRDKVDDTATQLNGKIDSSVARLDAKIDSVKDSLASATTWALILYIALAGTLFGTLARGFGWI